MMRVPILILWLTMAVAAPVWALSNEPTGFDKAEFRMSVEQVREVYPEMTEIDVAKVETIYALDGMANYSVAGVKVEGFADPADLVLRFYKDRLWLVRVQLSEDDAYDMIDEITKRHGLPTFGTTVAGWVAEKVMVTTNPKARFYEIFDREVSAEMAPLVYIGPDGVPPEKVTPRPPQPAEPPKP